MNEVKDTATAPLRAIRLLAEFFQAAGNQEKQEAVLGKLKELQNTSQEPTVHVMTATALIHVENHGDALRVLRSGVRRAVAQLIGRRTLVALVEPGSCFAGSLLELALSADRSYMLDTTDGSAVNSLALSPMNFGLLPMVNGLSRISARFYQDVPAIDPIRARLGERLSPALAAELGLVTATPDELDWDEEIRIAQEERAALSPDALTGLEANLRFGITENMNTRIFGRLSAWQNWIFIRPNAVGTNGALKLFGSGKRAQFNWERV